MLLKRPLGLLQCRMISHSDLLELPFFFYFGDGHEPVPIATSSFTLVVFSRTDECFVN